MSLWRQITRGLRVLARPGAADRDAAEEIEHFLAESTAAFQQRGLSPEAARRAARQEMGSPLATREQIRGAGWERVVETALADFRVGARQLRTHRAFASASVLTLALAIGAGTAIFGAAWPILLEPLPYPGAQRVVSIWDRAVDGRRVDMTFGSFLELTERSRSFEAATVMRSWQPTLTGAAEPERLEAQRVTADYFRVLGVPPRLGRGFEPFDDVANGPRVVIISHGLWHRRFGGDPTVVGREIALDGELFTVIGVMPADFENLLAPAADAWRPLQYDRSLPSLDGREWGHHLRMVARVAEGEGVERARKDLDSIARAPIAEFPRPRWADMSSGLVVERLRDDVTGEVRPALLAVSGAVLLLLAIACVNVTNLLLARADERRGEFAMRAALGAPRGRLVRQLLTESLLLSLCGGAIGAIVAVGGLRTLLAMAPADIPRAGAIGASGPVFAFGLALVVVVGLVVGLAPALHMVRRDLHAAAPHGSPRAVPSHRWTRRVLVVTEVALALVLLVGAGLLLRSVERLLAVPPGFDPSNVLTMQLQATDRGLDDSSARRYFSQALEAVRRVPGVEAAALTSQLPLCGDSDVYGVHFESSVAPPTAQDGGAFRYAVSSDYFAALRIPLLGGRGIDRYDDADTPRVVVVSESLARRRFPGRDALGQRLRIGDPSGSPYSIVGVAADVKQLSLAMGQPDGVYIPAGQWPSADRGLWLVVRSGTGAAALAPAIRAAVWSVDKDRPIVRVATMDSRVSASAAERRFALVLFEAFALSALLLAAIGIYGVLATDVAARTREIGVRSALGASRSRILAMFVGQGMLLVLVGCAVGTLAAGVASHALDALLFGVSRLDPVTYMAVAATIGAVAAIACWLPARRASRVDPSVALRV